MAQDTSITVRFNFGRMVATFYTVEELNGWLLKADLNEEFMYTIHGHGCEINLEKYKKSLEMSNQLLIFEP